MYFTIERLDVVLLQVANRSIRIEITIGTAMTAERDMQIYAQRLHVENYTLNLSREYIAQQNENLLSYLGENRSRAGLMLR